MRVSDGRELIVASKNQGKIREFASMFEPMGIRVRGIAEVGDYPDVVEDGDTFEENALKKAAVISEAIGLPVLADDSGLCVDALSGAPGVYSARYAGESASDADNNAKLLAELKAAGCQPDESGTLSRASFVCVLAMVDSKSDERLTVRGECPGAILPGPRGEGGFGYDPLFFLPEFGRSMAELSMDEKNRISHRAQALAKLLDKLRSQS